MEWWDSAAVIACRRRTVGMFEDVTCRLGWEPCSCVMQRVREVFFSGGRLGAPTCWTDVCAVSSPRAADCSLSDSDWLQTWEVVLVYVHPLVAVFPLGLCPDIKKRSICPVSVCFHGNSNGISTQRCCLEILFQFWDLQLLLRVRTCEKVRPSIFLLFPWRWFLFAKKNKLAACFSRCAVALCDPLLFPPVQ